MTKAMLAMVTASKIRFIRTDILSGRKNNESFEAMKTTMIPIRQLWMTIYLPLQAVL